MGLVLGGRARVVLTGHADASWVDDLATQRSSQGYTFRLGSGSFSWQSTHSSSVLSSSCEAEIYAGAMAAQELRWLTYLLTDLGEAPRSPPVLYVDNKAMLALCQEHRLEHRTKHIALRYFLARELQQCGQLRLAYVVSQANTADVFTKALQPWLRARFEPIAASISARQTLRTWRQLGSDQDYTSGFLALCEQVGYMHEAKRVDHYVGGLKPVISHEIMLRGLSNFNEILALAEKIDILRRPRSGSYYGHCLRGPTEDATIHAVAANAAAAASKGRYFACNRPGHRKSECPEEQRRRRAEKGRDSQRQGNVRSQYGSFEYTVKPFGLTNALTTIQMTMNEAFRPLIDKCIIVYLDDILVYSRDKQQHLADLEAVFKVLDEHQLLTKGYKCELFQDRLDFFGQVISEAGIEIDPKKLDTIKAWHSPTNITELQSFFGFVNYVHRFVPDMARLTAPLTDLLLKGDAFMWGEKEHAASQRSTGDP
ncbi:unnamed protein product [Closterium sp. NIES-54]